MSCDLACEAGLACQERQAKIFPSTEHSGSKVELLLRSVPLSLTASQEQ